ncbi:hypothetical protein BT63DRAFT_138390 [Microthyrium microscopicum]|uniref:Uncharacterized protein n=1 Tax=Microthyrium microscopicum TaxID=703497 RepID=A0A6A6UN32_9PEZI|nr:hypothetical protein BT63DRAFT_138390 [Microthyrium microscopicum]
MDTPEDREVEISYSDDEAEEDTSLPLLRNLSPTFRFWDDNWVDPYQSHRNLVVMDRKVHQHLQDVPQNMKAVMALNEIGAARGRGFFLHFPARVVTKKQANDPAVLPTERLQSRVGATYASMAYVNYVYSKQAQAAFKETSHRARYLLCDGVINPSNFLYPIQYCGHQQDPVFTTTIPSLVLLCAQSRYYFGTNVEMQAALANLLKEKPSRYKPDGEDSQLRIKVPPCIWDPRQEIVCQKHLGHLALSDLMRVYRSVVAKCVPLVHPSWSKIERAPTARDNIGTILGNSRITQWGHRLTRKGGKKPRQPKSLAPPS